MPLAELLFVYGTLMRKSRNPYAHLLQTRATYYGSAFLKGRLYHLGSYPGAIADNAARTKVFGDLFQLHTLKILETLDRYEGCHKSDANGSQFTRALVCVETAFGKRIDAWTYVYCGRTAGRPVITTGRFR